MERFTLAVCQMEVVKDKKKNIEKAIKMIEEAKKSNASLVLLPEMFLCPYDNSLFRQYAESESGQAIKAISFAAAANEVIVVAGSIPEMEDGKIYNSSFVFSQEGKIIGKHQKMHLFDIDIPGKICVKESDAISAGNTVTVIDTELGRLGIAICYDIRFPELMRLMTLKGAKLFLIPAVFNTVTGPAHWETILRMRAIDNQVFIGAACTARNEEANYQAYGHSMIVDPWGRILCEMDEKEGITYAEIDLSLVDKIREELPLLKHRRMDVYEIIEKV